MATGTVRVRGLKDLTRDFRAMSKDISRELRAELVLAADPVKQAGERLALSEIRNMPRSPRWSGMRIGVSAAKGLVFMVPQARGRGRKRPNLGPLLLEQAMEPALERNEAAVVSRVDSMLGRYGGEYGF